MVSHGKEILPNNRNQASCTFALAKDKADTPFNSLFVQYGDIKAPMQHRT